MGLIQIEDMEFFAYHGCFEEEKVIGNKFVVHANIDTKDDKAGITDDLNDAVNYQLIYEIITKEMQQTSDLLEHVAQRMIDSIYAAFPSGIEKLSIKVSKLNPPLKGQIGKVSVTLTQ